jgi:polyhydroxyalkanoate synthesis regulator phasin
MVSKKKVVAIAITSLALTVGTVGVSSAASKSSVKVSINKSITMPGAQQDKLAGILSDLVKKGTLTQAQADALTAAITSARSADDAAHAAEEAARNADRAALDALIAKTIGLDATVIKTRLAAGESLGAIAGSKKDAVIAVLVADETKRIDAAVTAGKLTAAQATTLKAGLVAHVTAEVNSVGGPMGGPGMGGRGHGHGGPGMGGHGFGDNDGDHGPMMGAPGLGAPGTGTTTGTTASYKA